MEKINFLKIAKISCLALGLSSLVFTSCSKDDPEVFNGNPGGIEVPGEVLNIGDFKVTYPENHTFGVWIYDDMEVYDYTFSHLFTMDKKSNNVRLMYFSLKSPETVEASSVDFLTQKLIDDYYCDDNGYEYLSTEAVALGGMNGQKISAMEVEHQIYAERYTIYNTDNKKVYSIVLQVPDTLRDSRYKELHDIVSSIKFVK